MRARIEAAIRLLYPDEMTPAARNVLLRILEDQTEAVPTGAASSIEGDE